MYLHKLEKDEKTTFLALAKHLAKIDDQRIDTRERYMIQYMTNEMGLTPDAEIEPFDLEKTLKVFYRGEARRVVILEAVGVCLANGEIDARQRALLDQLAGKFMLTGDFVERALAVVRTQLEVMEEFENLIQMG